MSEYPVYSNQSNKVCGTRRPRTATGDRLQRAHGTARQGPCMQYYIILGYVARSRSCGGYRHLLSERYSPPALQYTARHTTYSPSDRRSWRTCRHTHLLPLSIQQPPSNGEARRVPRWQTWYAQGPHHAHASPDAACQHSMGGAPPPCSGRMSLCLAQQTCLYFSRLEPSPDKIGRASV